MKPVRELTPVSLCSQCGSSDPCDRDECYSLEQGCYFTPSNQGGTEIKWTEDFTTNSQWSTWNGISYLNSATYCNDDNNDRCMEFRSCNNDIIYKNADIDLSNCLTATLISNHLKERGRLESSDCVKAHFSSDSGNSWSGDYKVFCDDSPSSPVIINIPDQYLSENFRLAFECESFSGFGEYGYIDEISIECETQTEVAGTCLSCGTDCGDYQDEQSCLDDNCNYSDCIWSNGLCR